MDHSSTFPHRLAAAAIDGFGVGLWRSTDPSRPQSLWLERAPGGFIAALSEPGGLVLAGFWRQDATRPPLDPEFHFERAWGPLAPRMSIAGANLSSIGQRILEIMGELSLNLESRHGASYADSRIGSIPWRDLGSARARACAAPPLDLEQDFLLFAPLDAPTLRKGGP